MIVKDLLVRNIYSKSPKHVDKSDLILLKLVGAVNVILLAMVLFFVFY